MRRVPQMMHWGNLEEHFGHLIEDFLVKKLFLDVCLFKGKQAFWMYSFFGTLLHARRAREKHQGLHSLGAAGCHARGLAHEHGPGTPRKGLGVT